MFILDIFLGEYNLYNSEDLEIEYFENKIKTKLKENTKEILISIFNIDNIRGKPFIIIEGYSKTKVYSYKELQINNYKEIF